MVEIRGSEQFEGAHFVESSLRRARFTNCDLSGIVMRAVDVSDVEIDAPWLGEDGRGLHVNGVDVAPMVEAELNRRFPGRALRHADTSVGLQTAWSAVEDAWATALTRVASLPPGSVDISIDGEWTFAQTLRHLVMATDVWLRQTVLGIPEPFHPLGQPHIEYESDGYDMSVFTTTTPTFAEVLAAREGRVAMVRDFLETVDPEVLAQTRIHPWDPDAQVTVTVLHCLHVILHEEWEHLRFALRDLDTIEESARVVP